MRTSEILQKTKMSRALSIGRTTACLQHLCLQRWGPDVSKIFFYSGQHGSAPYYGLVGIVWCITTCFLPTGMALCFYIESCIFHLFEKWWPCFLHLLVNYDILQDSRDCRVPRDLILRGKWPKCTLRLWCWVSWFVHAITGEWILLLSKSCFDQSD